MCGVAGYGIVTYNMYSENRKNGKTRYNKLYSAFYGLSGIPVGIIGSVIIPAAIFVHIIKTEIPAKFEKINSKNKE